MILCRYILICLALFEYGIANSQNGTNSKQWNEAISALKKIHPYTGTRYVPGSSMAGVCMLSKPQVVDSCMIEIAYTAEIVLDTLEPRKIKDIVVVQVGDSVLKYYGWVCWRRNMNYTLLHTDKDDRQIAINPVYRPAVDYAIFRDMRHSKLLNRHLLPRMNNVVFEYTEPLPRFDWKITSDTLTIAGYLCNRAEADFAGRHWVVWFTSAIPIDAGLWKFNGLPGLVLEAYDKQEYFHFKIWTIKQNRAPIICYDIDRRLVTREEYRVLEQKIHRHPFSDSSEFIMIPNPETNEMEFLPDDWEVPYNPIELE